ncbi:KpsF/GutQ family sugar-phosphate isomerase [Pedobacter chitinilyticus]|uniref:KpsF/GutQ family sugar-phosphate isomerase n=1 Tax=Pedobacter chitinilyticus TaxID=2233776 RepID=A0A443Z1X7_9SPHI|nr:KpsF/GutQ family sugar-phosphate isomerase [Pedobacter chitinilyticus]RWU10499.1 KpsF/GutQ family sugar-phosphate isomerase [Pedobacter chitinilyticus]
MESKKSIIDSATSTLKLESEAILGLINYIDDDFVETVNTILNSRGRVIVTGIGKSAIIAQKIVATFNSTGTPAVFMHAADAVHGDLGMIQKDDVVLCLSKSGNTPEIKLLAPLLKLSGNKLVGMLGNINSDLAKQADLILNTTVEKEACPHNLAPTTSTTAQLAMGDALAICLLQARNFQSTDFAKYHPGGSLGKRLYLKAGDIAAKNEKPSISPNAPVKDIIIEISKNRLGAVVVTEGDEIHGVITDGDIRRMLEKHTNLENIKASDLMNTNPKKIDCEELALLALEIIKKNNITQILVTKEGRYFGLVHLHDLLQEGIV